MNREQRADLIQQPDAIRHTYNCRVCNGSLLQVLNLGAQCLVDFLDSIDDVTLSAPLTLLKCKECSLVQLSCNVNPELMYRDFWYRSGINESMRKALANIVDSVTSRVDLIKGDMVLDIGCNDGTLLEYYPSYVIRCGIDPSNIAAEYAKKNTSVDCLVIDFFNESAVKEIFFVGKPEFKVITAVAMFYDLDDPLAFLKLCKKTLAKDGLLVIQMNYLYGMLEQTAFDNICHEHLTYFSVTSLVNLLNLCGLTLQDVEFNEVNGGSLRAYIVHHAIDDGITVNVANALSKEEALEKDNPIDLFAQKIAKYEEKINTFIDSHYFESGEHIFGYGASTRGSTLLQTFKCAPKLEGIAERDERKYGKYTAGTGVQIYPEDYCRDQAGYFLVLPWHFLDTIIVREDEWLNKGGQLIVPLPEPRIIYKNATGKVCIKYL